MVHILPLVNISGFAPELDKENELYVENRNGLLVQYIAAGHGIYKRSRWWYDNGQIGRDSNYKNDKLHGRCRWWDVAGELTCNEVWEDGKQVKG